MCGIVGILGQHEVAPALVEALRRLEYRGYDSAGIATVNAGQLDRRRALGKLVNLSDMLVYEPLSGKAGIGHTRWATHGAPSVANAHPHHVGRVAVVHNGIIENARALREELTAAGAGFESQTDTETIAHLVHSNLEDGCTPYAATLKALTRLEGAFALLLLFEGEEDLMIAARKGSPLAIGYGEAEMFVGSDAIALSPLTDRITYLEEGDHAVITRAGATIFNAVDAPVQREVTMIEMDAARVEKAGYRHFMAKEIAEQPAVLADVIGHYAGNESAEITLPGGGIDFTRVHRISMVACGTAYLACLTAKYWFERLAGLPVDVDIASEYRYRAPPIPEGTLAVFVSQSGETADTLAALRFCKGRAAKIVSVINVTTSSIARESDLALPIFAGAEIGVASTKAFTCQLTVLALCALEAARQIGRLDPPALARHLEELRSLPGRFNAAMPLEAQIESIARQLADAPDALFLGRGDMFPLAQEGALKLKEISYIHAEGYASGELKHGPIALVDEHMPVIVMAPYDRLFDKTMSNMQEVLARGGKVLLVTDARGAKEAAADVWQTLVLPDMPDLLAPVLYALPVQLLAYHTAVAKGTDVDQPRNLAKSVTVE